MTQVKYLRKQLNVGESREQLQRRRANKRAYRLYKKKNAQQQRIDDVLAEIRRPQVEALERAKRRDARLAKVIAKS